MNRLDPKPYLAQEFEQMKVKLRAYCTGKPIQCLQVFGSFARGDARLDSDVDLLVTFDPDTSVRDELTIAGELEDVVGRNVDVLDPRDLTRSKNPSRRDSIMSSIVTVYERHR